jgi:hypothetical protein
MLYWLVTKRRGERLRGVANMLLCKKRLNPPKPENR